MAVKLTHHGEQSAYFDWVRGNISRYPVLALCHAIPNGAAVARGKRADGSWSSGSAQAQKLVREGLVRGILDVNLPVRGRGDGERGETTYIGLWIEFKVGKDTWREDQVAVADLLLAQGHRVEEANTAEMAIEFTEDYLGVPLPERTQFFR